MVQIQESEVRRALSTVNDPELKRDLVSLDMVKSISIAGGRVTVRIELTTPACPLRGKIRADIEQALQALPGVAEVVIDFTAKVRGAPKPQGDLMPGVKNVLLVGAGKGGVGKSTCAVNLALALAKSGAAVGLLDADFHGPSIPIMLGLTQAPAIDRGKIEPLEAFGMKVMSLGLLTEPGAAVLWRGPKLHGAIKQLFADVAWGQLDYLVVDLPPGTGDIPISISQLVKPCGAVLVTTPQDLSLADVLKAKQLFDQVGIPTIGLVENMSGFTCPHCNCTSPIFDVGGGRRAAEAMRIDCLGTLPLEPAVRAAGDRGVPIVAAEPESLHAKAFEEIARVLAGKISTMARTLSLPVLGRASGE